MFVTALRPENEIYSYLPIPTAPSLENFAIALQQIPAVRMLINTFAFALGSTMASLLTAVLAAYALTRWRFFGAKLAYAIIALTWLVPFQVVMIPNYVLVSRLGLIDTITALVLPNMMSAFAVMMLVQSMRSFPAEVVEAARMDGASDWRILWRVIVPNLRAPLAALAILLFVSAWNEYFWPLLLTRSPETSVIQSGIQMFISDQGNRWGPLMAVSSIACLPVLAIYIVLQRQVIDSFVQAGLR
ncbi:carbohydrate ABC transporter permease [Ketogulonicigenium robustum]|nr:carbohydrate ABC transporter permease [Ketogulonicigenium robustum]